MCYLPLKYFELIQHMVCVQIFDNDHISVLKISHLIQFSFFHLFSSSFHTLNCQIIQFVISDESNNKPQKQNPGISLVQI